MRTHLICKTIFFKDRINLVEKKILVVVAFAVVICYFAQKKADRILNDFALAEVSTISLQVGPPELVKEPVSHNIPEIFGRS